MNLKKIALVVLFLAVTVGVGYLLYRFFFAAAPTEVVTTPTEETGPGGVLTGPAERPPGEPGETATEGGVIIPGLPTASPVAKGGVTLTTPVSADPVLEPKMAADGSLSYYNRADGKFYRTQNDGTLAAMSGKTFPEAQSVDWSPGADKAIIAFPDDSKVLYDFSAQRQTTLPKHWEDFSWGGDGRTVAAKTIGFEPENRWLMTFSTDGAQTELIEPLGDNADKVIVNFSPDGSTVAFSDTAEPIGFSSQEYLVIGQNGENNRPIRVEGFGFSPLWTPSGDSIIYSAAGASEQYVPTLYFVNAKGETIGDNRTNLGIHTWAEKCSFHDESTVYCAVPDQLPAGSGLEPGLAEGIPDSIYRIDLLNGTTTAVGRPEFDTTIKDVMVSPDASKLYYTDAVTGLLQEMRLK
jgi:hypothetical protein